MRSPSPRCLPNTITLYRFAPTQDADAGAVTDPSAYSQVIATDVACAIQPSSSMEIYDSSNRPTIVNSWSVLFGQDYGLKDKDKGVFVQNSITHTVYVRGALDYAGRASTWEAVCVDRL